MPDTYLSFCVGYGVFVGLLFLTIGVLLWKTSRLEKEISQLKQIDSK